jgi:hypothetical protein
MKYRPPGRPTIAEGRPAAPAGGRASAARAVPACLVRPLGLGGHPHALLCRPESHRDACRSGDRPRPGRPCSRRLSPRARRDTRGVASIPDDRHGRRLAGFSAGRALAAGVSDQLFRDKWSRGVGDLARDGCCPASGVITSPEHGCLGGAAVLARNGGIGAEPLGALPLGLGQAEPLTPGGLAAGRAAVRGRAPGGAPFDGPPACGVRAPQDIGHEHSPNDDQGAMADSNPGNLPGLVPLRRGGPHMAARCSLVRMSATNGSQCSPRWLRATHSTSRSVACHWAIVPAAWPAASRSSSRWSLSSAAASRRVTSASPSRTRS